MGHPYHELVDAVSNAGFYSSSVEEMGKWQRVTICSKRLADGRLNGNSFWVSQLLNRWYLGAWGGFIYLLPESDRLADLCVSWLTREPDRAAFDFDDQLKSDFSLALVSDTDFNEAIAGK